MTVSLCGGVDLDFSSFENVLPTRQENKLKEAWRSRLLQVPGGPGHVRRLIDVLRDCCADCKTMPLLAQVVHRLSQKIEVLMSKRLFEEDHPRNKTSRVGLSWKDASSADYNWVSKLPQYILKGVESTEFDLDLAFSTDKAWVGGLPLQDTTFLTQAGVAIIAIPQVSALDC